jgi:hypothetical protein
VDEGDLSVACYDGPPGTDGVAACRGGRRACVDGRYEPCAGQVLPGAETCEGSDQDCDGRVDEAFPEQNQVCSVGVGGCRRDGLVACRDATPACDAMAGMPEEETCDGEDDDCDGELDEDLSRACYDGPAGTDDVGLCHAGEQVCAAGVFAGVCDGQQGPDSEQCNGEDDDCDGFADEGFDLSRAVGYPTGEHANSVATGDLNGDGHLDLAVAVTNRNAISVLLGNGDGTFQPGVYQPTGTVPLSVAIGDLNGDGHSDLAVANHVGGNISVLLGRGNGTFQGRVNYETDGAPTFIAIGDLNRDARPDLVVANLGDIFSVLLGNGDGTFQPRINRAAGAAPYSVAMGDLNRDGSLDLAMANHNGNNVSVLLGNGDGTFQPRVNLAAGWRSTVCYNRRPGRGPVPGPGSGLWR